MLLVCYQALLSCNVTEEPISRTQKAGIRKHRLDSSNIAAGGLTQALHSLPR
jgi:hypothetical protein